MEGTSVRDVGGDRDEPFSRGHLCRTASAIVDVQGDPDRILEPQCRDGNAWQSVSWELALEEAGHRLAAIQRKYGRSSVGGYVGDPTARSHFAMPAPPFFLRPIGSLAPVSAPSVCHGPARAPA